VIEDLDLLYASLTGGFVDITAMERLGEAADPRLAWLLADILRFVGGPAVDTAQEAFTELTGVDISPDPAAARSTWLSVTDHLLAWDTPAPPGYVEYKGRLFGLIDERWAPFFADDEATIDWRIVSWGGVLLDDRDLGDPLPCALGCIPALDDPSVVGIAEGDWYPDDGIVFGVVVGNEARAYPKNIMEVHEMVNDTLGGRRIGIPYCTLCGSAQAYFTDDLASGIEQPLLRTSGLLARSNKVMFDLRTFSVFDTFTGEALTGPLREAGVVLNQTSVVTSTWGDWKAEHPETTIVAADGGINRTYPDDPLRGRDDNGPIFPVGDVDPRLPVQATVLGVIAADGTPVAFPVDNALQALAAGRTVALQGITVTADGSGIRVDGNIPGHESFWFAWSQFHPDTLVWDGVLD
jgi:hypothetical protein